MDSALVTFLEWIFWFYLGYMILGVVATYFHEKELRQKIREELDEKIRVVRLEDYEGVLLAYDGENNEFLGQGRSEDEIKIKIMDRFPTKIFLLHEKPFSALPINTPPKL